MPRASAGDGRSASSAGGGAPTLEAFKSQTASTSASPFVINITWDPSVQSAPSGFAAGVLAAAKELESDFSDPVTINIDVGYGEMGGSPMAGLGASTSSIDYYSYSQLRSALIADETTAADASAIASLSHVSPTSPGYYMTSAEAKALGLASARGTGIDGWVGFSSAYKYTYDDSGGVVRGTYDLKGAVLHELTEVMGRTLWTSPANPNVYQLFHYSSPGVIDYSSTKPGYFSIDGGKTSLAAFNTNPAGDAGDWAPSVKNDAADAFASGGVVNALSSADVTALDVIGWNADSLSSSPIRPVGISASTNTLSRARSVSGLNSNVALASFSEIGGPAGDDYTYVLGGSSATAFNLVSAGGVDQLVATGAGATGAANGKLYSLNVSVTDVSAGGRSSSVNSPVDIIVGSNGADVIHVKALAGNSGEATPVFVYGLGHGDVLDGSGMTGNLWFAGGPGADVMTGGDGDNRYLYSAVNDSTAAAVDRIMNFHSTKDVIDLSGISPFLNDAGRLTGSVIGAHSVGWQTRNGNTFVYVHAGSAPASLSSAELKIELVGNVALSSKNFTL
jgi:hypothetical protein